MLDSPLLHTQEIREGVLKSAYSSQGHKAAFRMTAHVLCVTGFNMQDFADAIISTPSKGLNVEQRKLLTIGVELLARPALRIFNVALTHRTLGQSVPSCANSWIMAKLRFLRSISRVHRYLSNLIVRYLQKYGKTVYFSDSANRSRTLLDYFGRNGARACGLSEDVSIYSVL